MAENKKKVVHTDKRSCGCDDCQKKLDEITLLNRTKMWFGGQLQSLSKNLTDFISIKFESTPQPTKPAKASPKRPPRKKKP